MLSYIEISKTNLVHNFHVFRSYLSPVTKIACVIKANAYGHGQNTVAKVLEEFADYWAVDDLQELTLLRTISHKSTLVLGYVAKSELMEAVRLDGIIGLYDIERARALEELAVKYNVRPRVHIKIDAATGRQGVLFQDLETFLSDL